MQEATRGGHLEGQEEGGAVEFGGVVGEDVFALKVGVGEGLMHAKHHRSHITRHISHVTRHTSYCMHLQQRHEIPSRQILQRKIQIIPVLKRAMQLHKPA